MDYYGKRLATASSDRTVRIFDVVEGQYQLIATLPGYVVSAELAFSSPFSF